MNVYAYTSSGRREKDNCEVWMQSKAGKGVYSIVEFYVSRVTDGGGAKWPTKPTGKFRQT